MIALLLLAQLVLADPFFPSWLHEQKFKDWFSKAKVGEYYSYRESDGCNTCSGIAYKVTEKEMEVGPVTFCTAAGCIVRGMVYEVPK